MRGQPQPLPEKPPRGRQYAITHLNYVAGPKVAAVVSTLRHDTLTPALKQQAAIDRRLNPQVILVEKED
jgi:hypothetical protein